MVKKAISLLLAVFLKIIYLSNFGGVALINIPGNIN